MRPAGAHPWLLLTYKIPRDPSGPRVFVWRTLKQLGAILLHDAAWVLPRTPWTRNRLQWLAAEIAQSGGEATVWEARMVEGERRALIAQFLQQVDAAYEEILADLEHPNPDLESLAERFRQVEEQDYFQSDLAERVRQALAARRGPEDR
jgi:hypothetical protein